jgi:RNA polymerase-binding transcription factor DksA
MREPLLPGERATLEATLRQRFEALRGVLHEHLAKSDDERAVLLADRVRDTEDESLTDLLVDLDLAEIDRDLDEIKAVEAALARMRAATYGRCVTCAGPIPFERLVAYPTASRCRDCQAVHERTHRGAGTPRL